MIKISNLNKYFYRHKSNEIHVINNTTLEFPETGLITILGESGSGKTTLMNVIGGLDDFNSGCIEIDGFNIKKYSSKIMDRIRSEKVGYIFQNYLLLQGRTVYENLEIILNMYNINEQEKNERIDYVLKSVGMLKYKKKSVSELSGGQQQRIAIARALIKSPSLILADEPTGNLDEKNTIQIMNLIKKISKTTLVILVSHEHSIAASYSDYIIEVKDGKIVKQVDVKERMNYQYEDDQNLYLKEYQYSKIENDNINIDFYSNENKKINIQIVYENGKFYIKSSDDVIYLNDESETKLLDEHKRILNAEQEIEENDFELTKLKFVKTPSLTFKEKIRLAFSNLVNLKKRTIFLSLPLFIISILVLFCIQSVDNASFVDRQHLVYEDSHIYNILVGKGDAHINNDVKIFGTKHLIKGVLNSVPDVEMELNCSVEFMFNLPSFSQVNSKKYTLGGFSVVSNERLIESDILYGRLPQNATELVVDRWVLENALSDSTLSNFMGVTSFLGKELSVKNKDHTFTVVGISETNENTIYMNKWAMVSFAPSNLKREGIDVISVSEFQKFNDIKLNLEENECFLNLSSNDLYFIDKLTLNDDEELTYNVKNRISFKDCPFDVVVSDDCYKEISISIASCNHEKISFYCDDDTEKNVIQEYVESVRDYYKNGELKAIPENGFYKPADLKDVILLLEFKSDYYEILNPYIEQSRQNVTSRLLVTITILLISAFVIFFSMRSYASKNIYDIGVYRAIGINKRSIVFVYALQILIISLRTTVVGCIICFAVTQIVSSIPLINAASIAVSFEIFIFTMLGLLVFNVLIGILPTLMYLRLTPSKLLTKTDL